VAGWEMAKHIENKVKKAIKTNIQNAKFVSLTCDEVISMDNASWAIMNCCFVQDYCYIPLLLNVKHVIYGFRVDNIILLITNFLMTQKGLHEEDFISKLVYFGVDGVNTFQGFRSKITVQIQQQYVPFVTSVHCMAHHINLVVQTFSHLPLVLHIEALLHCLYVYFNHSLSP